MSKFLIMAIFAVTLSACSSTDESDELGYQGFKIQGDTVQQTFSNLKSNPDVSIRTERGWTIATSEAEGVIWSFTPSSHPAHPSFVKREVIEKEGSFYINTSATCGAQKKVCDQLVNDFIGLNDDVRKEMSGG